MFVKRTLHTFMLRSSLRKRLQNVAARHAIPIADVLEAIIEEYFGKGEYKKAINLLDQYIETENLPNEVVDDFTLLKAQFHKNIRARELNLISWEEYTRNLVPRELNT